MSIAGITFVGICSHIERIRLTPPPDALTSRDTFPGYFTRTVVVNASHGYRWGTQGIPPHDAVLYIPKEFIVSESGDFAGLEPLDPGEKTWRMRGVQLYFADVLPGLSQQPSYGELPSLTERAGVLSLQLDPKVVLDGCAAAVVDMYAGVVDAYRNPLAGNAVHASLLVDTATANPELVITRMYDQRRSSIFLRKAEIDGVMLDPIVFVTNAGANDDKDFDFFLHYLMTTWTPPRDQPPPMPGEINVRDATEEELILLRDLPQGLTFGCSNSNYP